MEPEPIEPELANEQETSERVPKFFTSLNLGAGLSYLKLVEDEGETEAAYEADDLKHHLDGQVALQLGLMISPNLAMIGGIEYILKPKTKVETEILNGYEEEMTEFSYSYGISMLGFTYYFAPSDFYIGAFGRLVLGGSYETFISAIFPGATIAGMTIPRQTLETKVRHGIKSDGPGFGIVVGKQWLTGQERSFGLSLSYSRDALKFVDTNAHTRTITEAGVVNDLPVETSDEEPEVIIENYGINLHFKFNFY